MTDYYSKVLGDAAEAERPAKAPPGRKPPAGPGKVGKRKRRAYAYRIEDQDAARVKILAQDLETSQDALMRALVPAVLEAVEQGGLTLETAHEVEQGTTTDGLLRAWVVRKVRWAWAAGKIEKGG